MDRQKIIELYFKYRNWVSSNPVPASDVETTVKWISYYLAARVKNTKLITELVYSLSNLLVFFNDRIISESLKPPEESTPSDKIKLWLTVLDYVEVLFELSARQTWREKGKWSAAALIQVIKCAGRLMLVLKYKENIVQVPPIQPLKRREAHIPQMPSRMTTVGFRLPNSGRIIRSVDGVDPNSRRQWKPPSVCDVYPDGNIPDAKLNSRQTIAEIIYILKPLLHLCAIVKCGPKTWRPYFLALLLDVVSLHLFRESSDSPQEPLSSRQSQELSRRRLVLLLYILRSPFYERFSGRRIDSVLQSLSSNVPLVGLILRPLAEYLPTWQDSYFYMWSS